MATDYGERIARVEENQKNTLDLVKGLDTKMDKVIDRIDNLPDVFITRREGNVLRTLIAILLAAVSALATVLVASKR